MCCALKHFIKIMLKEQIWKTSQREFDLSERVRVMAILNVTPDSFSDGGKFSTFGDALRQAEQHVIEGADMLDVGGESTRPGGQPVDPREEIDRVVPVIEELKRRFDIAISIDTSKSEVAEQAVNAGAEIINDVSGLRFDSRIAEVAAKTSAGLILMHLRGDFETMHQLDPVENILDKVSEGFEWSIQNAKSVGVKDDRICLDIGIGFSKTIEQNLELIAKLDELHLRFANYPLMVGTSRKSFIGKLLGGVSVVQRLNGTIASNVVAVLKGAKIIRVHDVKPHVEAVKIIDAIMGS